jgi:hypothetical protein
MHDLEKLIAEWRKAMMTAPNVGHVTLDELENHLREHTDQLIRAGMTEPEAFQRAVAQLGSSPTISSEFEKLGQPTWLPVKVVIGTCILVALATFVMAGFNLGRSGFLLASHVFMMTLGYTTTFLVGALGICFVGQRCFSDFSPSRIRSLRRVTLILGCVAAGLTGVGIILAMVWAKAEWSRYWAWDPKEIGGLCVLVWLICFVAVHRLRRMTTRGVLVMSVLGNIVVSLAWFGANLLGVLHNYGTSNHGWFLLAAIIFNLTVFLVGLGPAGLLRLRKAEH